MKQRYAACLAVGVLVLAGCAQPTVRTRPGAFFTLTSRNVAYRDLTQPFGVDNDSTDRTYGSFPAALPTQAPSYAEAPVPPAPAAAHAAPLPIGLPRTPVVQTAKLDPLKVPAYTPVYVPPKPATTAASRAAALPTVTAKAGALAATPAPKQAAVATATKAPQPAATPPVVHDSWDAQSTQSFHEVINSWASIAGWNVLWQYGPNFPPQAGHFTGSFPDAGTAFANQYLGADDPPHLCFYPDQQPKPLVRVIHGANCD